MKISHQDKLLKNTVQNTTSELMCSSSNSEYDKIESIEDTSKTLLKNSDSPVLITNNTTPHKRKDYQTNILTPSTSTERKISSFFTPKSSKSLRNDENHEKVICPVCKVNVCETNINKHLDDCLKRENAKAQPKKNEPKLKPLPKLVFCLMKDSEIKKKLKQFGLSTQGDRRMLEKRLNKYTIYYNAERDKVNPRPISEIIKQLEEEENIEKKANISSHKLNINRCTEHNIIEQQRKKYLAENRDNFDKIIAKIKPSKKLPVRRNMFSKEYSNISHNNNITETKSSNNSIDPKDFVITELSSNSSDFTNSTNQSLLNHKTSNRACSSDLETSIVKTEKVGIEEMSFFKRAEIQEEIICTNQSRDNILKHEIDSNIKKSIDYTEIEPEYKQGSILSMKKSRSDIKCSLDKRVANSEHTDERQKDLSNKDLYEDVCIIEDNVGNIQDDYDSVKQTQLRNTQESNCTKSEKENLESRDEDVKTCAFRKREREVMLTSNDEEKYENKSTAKKLTKLHSRFCLSEAKNNNETFAWDEENSHAKSQSQKKQSRVTRAKNRSTFAKKSVRLKSKTS
ncbi:E3 ubiquitin-protein ligase RAD18-like isoform X2 [Pseudomyrmex gracilis]|nr:E3 ubiquitin-protein ligase RAD18-like isoform X2 [Pseudomyrmex gracilis]